VNDKIDYRELQETSGLSKEESLFLAKTLGGGKGGLDMDELIQLQKDEMIHIGDAGIITLAEKANSLLLENVG